MLEAVTRADPTAKPQVVSIGDTIDISTQDIDGWLIAKIEAGYLNDDPYVTKYWKNFGALISTPDFDWDDLAKLPVPPEVSAKYGDALARAHSSISDKEWLGAVLQARGETNGFIRRKASEMRLIIDDVHFDDLAPELVEYVPQASEKTGPTLFRFTYRLERNAENNAHWHELLHEFKFKQKIRLTLGLRVTNGTWIFMPTSIVPDNAAGSSPLWLRVVVLWRFLAALAIIAAALFIFFRLSSGNLLRDTDAMPRPFGSGDELVYPLSLARSQMAFWFFMVMSAYLFIWLATERLDGLNTQMLGLVGISAGTALGAAFITSGKGAGRSIDEEKARSLDMTLSLVDREAANRRAMRLSEQRERLKRSSPFNRIIDDWLSEDGSTSFHRFQMLAWTFVLGLIFVTHVWSYYAMPEFSGTILALMGISSGTYLGFKLPEQR